MSSKICNTLRCRVKSLLDHAHVLSTKRFRGSAEETRVRVHSSTETLSNHIQTVQFYTRARNFISSNKSPFKNRSFAIKFNLIQSQQVNKMSTMHDEAALREKYRPKDCKFETSYGHIAALEWGDPNAIHKILCVHGWLDNAGSFERLVPFILDHGDNASKYHIVAMDHPGVGLSSHMPPGTVYNEFTTIIEMRRIMLKLNWTKVTLLSHSLGAHLSFIYSAIYPDQVESFVSIDLAHPMARQMHNWNVSVANSISDHFRVEYHHADDPTTNIRIPVYSEVDAIKRLMDGHSNSLTKESAEVMLKRGATKQQWGYTFNRDLRLRYLSPGLPFNDDLMHKCLIETFHPNLLIIRAKRSPYQRPEELRLKYYELFEKNCPIFAEVMIDGTHHLHINSPELVAPEVNKFLDSVRKSKQEKLNKSNL